MVGELTAKLGYPTSGFAIDEVFREVPFAEAAGVLAYIARGSLAYPSTKGTPRDVVAQARLALGNMGDDARYFTNGDWGAAGFRSGNGWTPISGATFDAGLVGFGKTTGFIIWTEDED